MTVAEIVAAALRKIGVVQMGATPTADQIAYGADAFNAMVASWALEGINLWLSPDLGPLADYQPRAATDDAGIPAAFREGAVFCLAARIAPEYSLSAPFDDEGFKIKMRAALMVLPTMQVEQPMRLTPNSPHYRWMR